MSELLKQTPDIIWLIVLFIIAVMVFMAVLPYINQWYYQFLRASYQESQKEHLADFHHDGSEHFTYAYRDISEDSLALIKEESEKIFAAVNDFFAYAPKTKIPVVIYPTSEQLNASFGWDGDRSPMGVYWMGYINVLAPEAWINGSAPIREQIFCRMGPMAHEYSHLIIDEQTGGNYPRWFSEGVAQYVEQSLGYFTIEAPKTPQNSLYDFAKLERSFDQQLDQTLAYWQSLQAVEYLTECYGEAIIPRIIAQLGQGKSFCSILRELTGHNYQTLAQAIA